MGEFPWRTFTLLLILITIKSNCRGEDYDLYEFGLTLNNDKIAKEGRQQYENLVQYSKLPRYGTCWTEALSELETGCKDLTEDVQRKLAFTFANCFLKGAGRKSIRCPLNAPISQCLGDADHTSFSAYQQFFVHTQNICFFLQSEAWQAGAMRTISKLSSVSTKVAEKLQETGAVQDKILNLQRDSYGIQQQIIEQGQVLGLTLQESQIKAEQSIKQFEKNTKEQQMIIHKVFDRIVQIQTSVFGLFSGIDSIMFYVSALSMTYLVSMPERARGARIILFPLWAINMVLESRIKRPDISNQDNFTAELSRLEYEYWILFWRTVTTILVILAYIYHYIRYIDYNYQTYKKLEDVTREMADLKSYLLRMTPSTFSNNSGFSSQIPLISHATRLCYDSDDSQYDSTFVGSSSESDIESETSHDSFMSILTEEQYSFTTANEEGVSNNLILSSSIDYQMSLNNSTGSYRYNLRSRSSTPVKKNPILNSESPKMFEKNIKNYRKLR